MTVGIEVRLKGEFFRAGMAPVMDSLNDAVNEVMLTGEREAKLQAQPGPGGAFHTRSYAQAHGYFQTGHYNRSINGRMVGSMHGIISDSNVVYGPWLEGTSSRNQATRFKGYSIFRKTRDKLDRLTAGIVTKHVIAAVKRLNG
jgi:hypothetical protein